MLTTIGVLGLIFLGCFVYLYMLGATYKHFGVAFLEAFFVFVLSNAPILYILWLTTIDASDYGQTSELITTLLKSGDILIYLSAILAPVFWVLIAHARESHRVLSGIFFLISLLLLLFSASAYRDTWPSDNFSASATENGFLILYITSIIVWYGSIVYKEFIGDYDPSKNKDDVLSRMRKKNG